MENMDLRLYAKGAGVSLWRIADKLGVSEATVTRMLRKPLNEVEKRDLIGIIDQFSKEARQNG